MADSLALNLVDKGLVTNQLVLTVGYDIENLAPTRGGAAYAGETTTDRYGRKIPKHAVGTENFSYTSSANDLLETITALYDRIVDKALLVRRLSISANRLLHEEKVPKQDEVEQLDLFTDYAAKEKQKAENAAEHARERKIQETILGIKKKFGKNAILKGLNLEDGATARERNQTIGGHQASAVPMMILFRCRILPLPDIRECLSQTERPSFLPLRLLPVTAQLLPKRRG